MKIIAKYLSIILGFLYCLFIFWNRVIRERLPKDLFTEYTSINLYTYNLLFVVCFFLTIYFIKQIFHIKPKYRLLNRILQIPFIENLSNKFLDIWILYIINAPKNFYEFLYKHIYIRPFIDKCCDYITKLEMVRFINYFLIFKYSFIIILTTIFIHNIFFLHSLEYFYKYIWLLLIPTLFDLFIFSVSNLAKKNQKVIEERIIMTLIPESISEPRVNYTVALNLHNKNNILLKITDQIYLKECLKFNGDLLLTYFTTQTIIDEYYTKEKKVQPYIYVYVFGLYTIGWGYVLFNIFF